MVRLDFERRAPWTERPFPPESGHLPASPDCFRMRDGMGVLRIRDHPLRTGHVWVPPDVATVTYGYAEARMRFMGPQGAHSCFWLQTLEPYATPFHHEVDIAEHFGNPNRVHHTIHWKDSQHDNEDHFGSRVVARDWHVYGVEISPEGYQFTVDGKFAYKTWINAPAIEKVLILSFLSDDWERPKLKMDNLRDYKTYIDWVKVEPA